MENSASRMSMPNADHGGSPPHGGARPARRVKQPTLTDDEVRQIILRYLYRRNQNATSRTGRSTGAAVTISTLRHDLKSNHGISIHQVHSNLTYLESQGWVEDRPVQKTFRTPTGNLIPSVTHYFVITAAGIDRLAGKSMFTRDRFEGIKIEATGQNIITLGDGNQIDARFERLGTALGEFRQAIKGCEKISDGEKMQLVVDIDTLQMQLARPTLNGGFVSQLWQGIARAADIAGLASAAAKVGTLIMGLLS